MQDRSQRIELVENEDIVHDDISPWGEFEPDDHTDFFPESSRRLQAYQSPNGQYWAAFATRESTTIDGVREPAGICLIDHNEVLYSKITEPVENAYPANDGTIISFGRNGTHFTVLDRSGDVIFTEEFESAGVTMAVSPNGQFTAIATAFPDNAIHLYNLQEPNYLGRKENPSTTVVMDLEFESTRNGYELYTYEIHPDSELAEKVDPARTKPIDRIPVKPISNDLKLDGIGIVIDNNTWHHVPAKQIEKINNDLRIPGVAVETTCGISSEPVHADLIFDDAKSASKSKYRICSDCRPVVTSHPSEKVEKTRYGS